MAVVVQRQYSGVTMELYDDAAERLGFAEKLPEGMIFHFVVATGDGFRIIDVWETVEQFEEYVRTLASPVMMAVGLHAPMRIEVTNVHSYFPVQADGQLASIPFT